jgi:hypothetical protein
LTPLVAAKRRVDAVGEQIGAPDGVVAIVGENGDFRGLQHADRRVDGVNEAQPTAGHQLVGIQAGAILAVALHQGRADQPVAKAAPAIDDIDDL